jgi:succinoglycan biosynthesis transport protein ExoP
MANKPIRGEESRYEDDEQPLRSIPPAQGEIGPNLRNPRTIIWLRKWSILAITLLAVGLALFISDRQTPIYESDVSILVTPVPAIETDSGPLLEPNLETEAELIKSVAVAEIAANDLDVSGPPRKLLDDLSVDHPTDTEILVVNYRHADPIVAQRNASAFADAYLLFRERAATEAISRSANDITDQIQLVTADLDRVNGRLQRLSETDPRRGILEGQVNLLSTQILQLQLELTSLPDEVTVGRIIQPAQLPSSPVSPNHIGIGLLGVVAGLGLGIGFAFVRDRLSERLRSTEEVEAYLEAPVLAAIPRVTSWRRRKDPFLVTAVKWRSPPAEAYRVLRTNVLSAAGALAAKSVVVTSAHAGEGKSATVANLGVVLARAGKRVCLMSADLRRPRLHEFFGRDNELGLIQVLAGRTTLAEALQVVTLPVRGSATSSASLAFLPSGSIPDDPTELITSERLAQVLTRLEEVSDIVLVDVPPVLSVTDALVVAELTKAVLLVIGPTGNNRPTIVSVRQRIDRVGARIVGATLNSPDDSLVESHLY